MSPIWMHRVYAARLDLSRTANVVDQRRALARPLERFVGWCCYSVAGLSTGTASNGDSKAMKRTHGTALAQNPLCGRLAGPYA